MSLAATKFVHVGLFLRKKMVAFLFQPAAELLDRVPKRLVIADFDLSFLFAYLLHLVVNILRERAAKDSFITQDRNEHLSSIFKKMGTKWNILSFHWYLASFCWSNGLVATTLQRQAFFGIIQNYIKNWPFHDQWKLVFCTLFLNALIMWQNMILMSNQFPMVQDFLIIFD